jgi:hypothetical protein
MYPDFQSANLASSMRGMTYEKVLSKHAVSRSIGLRAHVSVVGSSGPACAKAKACNTGCRRTPAPS